MENHAVHTNARWLTFLYGPPNFGQGALVVPRDEKSLYVLTPQTKFYKEQAIRAAEIGVCIDLFLISSSRKSPESTYFMGLSSTKFLSLYTGGNVVLYDNLENSNLPQDMLVGCL